MKSKEDIIEEVFEKYEILDRIGRGRTGVVYKAFDKNLQLPVAIKRVYEVFKNKSDCERLLKEIKIFEFLSKHPNIIRLLNVIRSDKDSDLYLVFDYMEGNLFNVIRAKILTEQHIKLITYQLLKAVKYFHSAGLINRNLKPNNILINSDCKIKLDDFSLAKSLNSLDDMNMITDYVATRWYRAPEMLLGSLKVGKASDIWSIGCILGEMLKGKTLFPGTCTLNQLNLIVSLTGFPSKEDIQDINGSLTGLLESVKKGSQKSFNEFFIEASYDATDLLNKLLQFNPLKRFTVEEALSHPFLSEFRKVEEEIVYDENSPIELELSEENKSKVIEYKENYSIDKISRVPTDVII
jgi:mitogen-activated protein kinase 15